jgi:hypothetical protein
VEWSPGRVTSAESETSTVDPFPYGDSSYNTIYAPAYSERCTSSWWFGNPVDVTNRGCGTMAVRGY